MAAKSILCCIPAFGQQITATTFLSTHQLQQALNANGIGGGITCLSYPDIAELRNIFLTIWYDTCKETHLLFIDADMGFDPQLVLDLLLFDEPIVGALCPKRTLPVEFAGNGLPHEKVQRRGGFMSVAGVGMAITLIKRETITTMLEKMPEIVDTRIELHGSRSILEGAGAHRIIRAFDKIDNPETGIMSEDLSFCKRWTDCGGEVWASIAHTIAHVGPYSYTGNYLQYAMQKDQEARAKLAEAAE